MKNNEKNAAAQADNVKQSTEKPQANNTTPPPNAPAPVVFENTAQNSESRSGAQTAVQTMPAPPVKKRRIGTITMALSLIAVGMLMVVYVIYPKFDIFTVVRFFPAVLILLGIEILVSAIFFKEHKFKYDGLSIFICILLLGASALSTLAPYASHALSGGSYNVDNRLRSELENESHALVSDIEGIYNLRWSFYINYYFYEEDMQVSDINASHSPQVQVQFSREFKDEKEFAAECKKVLERLKTQTPYLRYVSFYSYPTDNFNSLIRENVDNIYELRLDGAFQLNWNEDMMVRNIYSQKWSEEFGKYVTPSELNDLERMREENLLYNLEPAGTAMEDRLPEYFSFKTHNYYEDRGIAPIDESYSVSFSSDTNMLFTPVVEHGSIRCTIHDLERGDVVHEFLFTDNESSITPQEINLNGDYVIDILFEAFLGSLVIENND